MSFNFIFMLTANDRTVPEARQRLEEVLAGYHCLKPLRCFRVYSLNALHSRILFNEGYFT